MKCISKLLGSLENIGTFRKYLRLRNVINNINGNEKHYLLFKPELEKTFE